VVAVFLVLGLLSGCGAPTSDVPQPSATPAAPVVTTLPAGGPPTAADVVACLTPAPSGATATQMTSLPPGATEGVAVQVSRPDLPRGINQITAVAFTDPARSASFAAGSGAFVRGTGGTAEVVGSYVLTTVFPGDDMVLATLRACVAG